MIKNFLKKQKYIYFFYRRYLFPYFVKQEKEILFLRDFEFKTSVDIGANVGTYTVELQKNSRKVICIEPLKENILYYRVENSIGKENYKDKSIGIGKPNLKKRLNLLYPNKHRLSFEEVNNIHIAKLEIQLQQ